MLTSVSLAYLSSSGDRALKAKVAQEAGRKKDKGQLKERSKADKAEALGRPILDAEGFRVLLDQGPDAALALLASRSGG